MTIDAAKLREYAGDPTAFLADLIIRTPAGLQRFGDAMAPFQRKRFATLCPALLAVARGETPPIARHWWEATKGSSKDSDLAAALLWLLAFSERPLTCQVGAADKDQASELRRAAKTWVHCNGWLAERVSVQTACIVCEATGCTADIIAADVAGSHGARPDVLILNELSHVTKTEFAQNLMDNAAKVPTGLVVIATNAGFLGTYPAEWREIARTSPGRWSFHVWSKPAPWIQPEELAEAMRRNPKGRGLRLFYGVWSTNNGDALDPEWVQSSITLQGPMSDALPGWTFVAGLDLGVSKDHAAFVVLGIEQGQNVVSLVACKRWAPSHGRQIDLAGIERHVIDFHSRFHLRSLWYDKWQAEQMSQNFRRIGLRAEPMHFSGKSLNLMASSVLESFSTPGKIALYDEPDLIRDLQRLSIVETPAGFKLTSVRDADGHADAGIAFAIGLPEAVRIAGQQSPHYSPPVMLSIQPARLPMETAGLKSLHREIRVISTRPTYRKFGTF